jgi:hypothetical protein
MSTIRILVVPARGPARVDTVDNDNLEAMQKIVGGPIEPVPVGFGGVLAIVNENGKIEKLPENRMCIVGPLGVDYLVGDMFFCAGAGCEDFLSLTDAQLKVLAAMVVETGRPIVGYQPSMMVKT